MIIGWLIPSVGCFGAVREMVEASNVLVERGHRVTIYHPAGTACTWLPCRAGYGTLDALSGASLDVLIGIIDQRADFYDRLCQSRARVQAVCLMGFAPREAFAEALRGERQPADPIEAMLCDCVAGGRLLLPDGPWQGRWLAERGIECGPAWGGINLAQFHPVGERHARRVVASGDPRPRKGSDVTGQVLYRLAERRCETDTYFGKRLNQGRLVEFYSSAAVFLDGHRRGGWCNPVAEALACGAAVVCTRIGATEDLALDGETALVVEVDEVEAMTEAALRLMQDDTLRARLSTQALAHVQQFDYHVVVPALETALEERR